jgi:hypothetical protein
MARSRFSAPIALNSSTSPSTLRPATNKNGFTIAKSAVVPSSSRHPASIQTTPRAALKSQPIARVERRSARDAAKHPTLFFLNLQSRRPRRLLAISVLLRRQRTNFSTPHRHHANLISAALIRGKGQVASVGTKDRIFA